jgi:sigma-B regulation protein RsbU (phosphoserine phosphatase)
LDESRSALLVLYCTAFFPGGELMGATELDRLRHLVEAARMLNASLDLNEILESILTLASTLLPAERSSLFLVDAQREELWTRASQGTHDIRIPLSTGIAGHVATTGETLITEDAYGLPFFNSDVDRHEGFVTRSVLCVPMRNKRGTVIGVLETLNKPDGSFSDEDSRFLEDLGSQAAVAIENALLHESLLFKRGLERDLAIAVDIQHRLLRPEALDLPGLSLRAFSQPARHVGGDFYDYSKTSRGTELFAIGDVSGKGIPAALVMSNLLACLRTLAATDLGALDLTRRVNTFLTDLSTDLFCTAVIGEVDLRTRRVSFCNAGHPPPILLRAGRSCQEIRNAGLPLGVFHQSEHSLGTVELAAGDFLFLYTDGLVDARNNRGDSYKLARLKALLEGGSACRTDEIVRSVRDDLEVFTRGAPQVDDCTVLAFGLD